MRDRRPSPVGYRRILPDNAGFWRIFGPTIVPKAASISGIPHHSALHSDIALQSVELLNAAAHGILRRHRQHGQEPLFSQRRAGRQKNSIRLVACLGAMAYCTLYSKK
jgi:hypothetical protein